MIYTTPLVEPGGFDNPIMTKLSIIILSYNTASLTLTCLQSLVDHYKKELDEKVFEIIVVDNNSSDNSVETIETSGITAYISLIKNPKNDGFAKGINLGAGKAKGIYLLFLNSDTKVQDSGLIDMVTFLEQNPEVGVAGGRLQNPDGTYQASAGVFYTLPRVALLLAGGERFGHLRFSSDKKTSVDWLSGAMMMIKKSFFEQVGKFDEKIFMYMEDMELCFRVKKAGKQVIFYPACTITHVSHASSNRAFAIVQIYKGIVYFYEKHQSATALGIVKAMLFVKAYCLFVLGFLIGNAYLRDTYKKALAVL